MEIHSPDIPATLEPAAALDRLGDEIAELSAHIEVATAHLLHLIREFDARGGGIADSAPARPGLAGGSGSTLGPPARGSAWRARWGHYRSWLKLSATGSSRTQRSGP